jgi:hypothetical protein
MDNTKKAKNTYKTLKKHFKGFIMYPNTQEGVRKRDKFLIHLWINFKYTNKNKKIVNIARERIKIDYKRMLKGTPYLKKLSFSLAVSHNINI